MIDMPSKMTPELISTVESFSDLPKVPFYISDYLDDAVDRLRAVAPISVRDRKKVIHLFEDPAIDPRDDEIFYTSFLDFIEEDPAGIMSITATLSAGIAQRKVLKLPGWRFWDAVGQPDVWQEIQTSYLLAPDGADGKDALFRLFMLYCVTQAATAHLRETSFPAAKTPTEDGNLLEQIFPEETYQACDDDDGPMSAVSIAREDEWREQCRQIEAVAAAMREELDANRIGEIYDLLDSLEAMTEPEQEDVPERAACMSALSSVFDDQEVAALSPKLDGLDAEALQKIIEDVAVLRVAFHEWRITETRRADLGAAMDTAVAAQQWIETSRLSQELPIADAELERTLALRDAALRTLTECFGNIRLKEDLSDGVARKADPVQGADEPVVPLIVDTALLDDVRSQLEVQPEGETDAPEDETQAESCNLTPLPVAPEPDSPQVALGDEAVGGARTPSWDPGVDGDLPAARSDLVIPAEISSDPTVQGIHADIGQPTASPSIDVDDASVSQRIAELIATGQIAIAARFAGALEECGVVPPIESEVLRVVAASRTSFEGYDSNAQDFATMANAAAYDGHPDAGRITEYRGALLLAALLRPSVLLPDLQTRQIVSDLNLKSYGPALSELQDEISKLDYSFSPSLQDLAKNSGRPQVSRLQAVVQEIEQWHEQALVRRGPCQPSTKVMNIIVTTREVGVAVKAVIDRQPDAAAMVQVAIERYADRESILLRAGEINRGSGTRSKGFLPQISLNFMHRNISEGIDLLVRWRDISQREGRRGSGSLDHLPRPVSALRAKTKAALAALQPGDDPLDTAVASWISSQLEAFDQMLTGQYPEQFMTLDAALSDELDLLPAGCQPASTYHLRGAAVGAQHLSDPSMRETQAVIHSVLDGRIATPKSSFDEKLLSGAYVAASRLVARVHSDPAERGRLVNQIEVSRKTRLDALDAQTEHLSGVLKDLVKIDLKFQDDIARELDRLGEIKERIGIWRLSLEDVSAEPVQAGGPLDVFHIPEIHQRSAALIDQVRAAIKDDQRERLKQMRLDRIGDESEIHRTEAEFDDLSPEMIEDRIALIRDGRPIGFIEDEKSRPFYAFFPGFVEKAIAEGWPTALEGYTAAFEATSGPLNLALERRSAATDLVGAWFRIVRQLQSDVVKPQALNGFLEALTFVTPRTTEAVRVPGVRQASIHNAAMTFQPPTDWFCPPEFGSKAQGHYRICVMGPGVLFDQIDGSLEQDVPTFILVADRMSTEKRREFATKLRRRSIPALLIDEALVSYVAVSTTPRLETLFDCALPFGRIEPYTTAAGRLPPEMFFGREREIDQIFRKDVDGCLVYGGRQLGKSALLEHVAGLYHNPEKGIIVRRREMNSLGGRAEAAGTIWARIAQMLGDFGIVSEKETTEAGVVQAIKHWLNENSSRRIILLLDEVDRFMSSEARNDHPNLIPLKALMEETHRSFKVVFAGLHNVRRMHKEGNSPLAHFGNPVCIGPLNATHDDKVSARALVLEPMRAAGFEFEDERAAENILAYVNHYPSLVQTYCKHLLRHLHSRAAKISDGPLWKIPTEMLFDGEGFDEIRREIRAKFQLTLDLDPRYALIANVLGLIRTDFGDEKVLRTGLSPTDIREETLKHWPQNLQMIDDAGFRVLLDEMFELGVLGRVSEAGSTLQYRYVLRTRQVAQMLGAESDIIEAIFSIQDREPEVDYDASNYRRAYAQGAGDRQKSPVALKRCPLTDSQITSLVDSQHPGCRFVTGIPALGLRDVAQAFERVIEPSRKWGRVENIEVATVNTGKNFRKEIERDSGPRRTKHLRVIFVRGDLAELREMIRFAEGRSQVQSGDVRPIFLLDAMNDGQRDLAIERDAISLMPWGHEMLRAHLHESEVLSLDSRDLRDCMLRITGGVPQKLCDLVRECANQQGRITIDVLKAMAPPMDLEKWTLGEGLSKALRNVEEVEDVETYGLMAELFETATQKRLEDIVPDLRTLGIVRRHNAQEGQFVLTDFGRMLSEQAKAEKRQIEFSG